MIVLSKRNPHRWGYWDLQVFDVNVHGMLAVTQAVVPYMASRRQGKIINVSSSTTRRASLSPEALQGRMHREEMGCGLHEGLPHTRGLSCLCCAGAALPLPQSRP